VLAGVQVTLTHESTGVSSVAPRMPARLWLPAGSGGHVSTGIRPGGIQEERAARCERRSQPGGDRELGAAGGATKETVEVTRKRRWWIRRARNWARSWMRGRWQICRSTRATRISFCSCSRRDVDGGIEQQYRLRKRRRGCGFGEWRPWALQQFSVNGGDATICSPTCRRSNPRRQH